SGWLARCWCGAGLPCDALGFPSRRMAPCSNGPAHRCGGSNPLRARPCLNRASGMNANDPAVSVVVPVRNEAGNIELLVMEIAAALGGQWPFEVVYVDDGSSDGTEAELKRLM